MHSTLGIVYLHTNICSPAWHTHTDTHTYTCTHPTPEAHPDTALAIIVKIIQIDIRKPFANKSISGKRPTTSAIC